MSTEEYEAVMAELEATENALRSCRKMAPAIRAHVAAQAETIARLERYLEELRILYEQAKTDRDYSIDVVNKGLRKQNTMRGAER